MKKILSILIIMFFSISNANGQNQKSSKGPAGQWDFSAPYAPEGFNTGTMSVGLTDKKYTVSMAFTGSDYSFTGEDVMFRNDSLLFSVYIEGAVVDLGFKMEGDSKMSGSASTPDGPIPVNVERAAGPEKNKR